MLRCGKNSRRTRRRLLGGCSVCKRFLHRVVGRLQLAFAVHNAPAGFHRAALLAADIAPFGIVPHIDERADAEVEIFDHRNQIGKELRLTLGRPTTADEVDAAAEAIIRTVRSEYARLGVSS